MFGKKPLAELHAHIGAAASPWVMWSIAHEQGIKLPTKDYWEYVDLVTLSPNQPRTLEEYLDTVYHPLNDGIQSSTIAMERVTHEIIGEAYRKNNVTVIELRYNPMKRNRGGEQDLDHIIMATLRGMDKALLEYPQVSAGIIFCLDRQFTYEHNKILVEKAIRYRRRGVVGIDFANYDTGDFHFKDYQDLVQLAKKAKLHLTAHTGETKADDDIWEALDFVEPERIGHGIRAAYDKALVKELAKRKVVLEICPLSNLSTKAIENVEELKFIIRTFIENKVLFTINTDWPQVISNGTLADQFAFLLRHKIMHEDELEHARKLAFSATFVPKAGIDAYL